MEEFFSVHNQFDKSIPRKNMSYQNESTDQEGDRSPRAARDSYYNKSEIEMDKM